VPAFRAAADFDAGQRPPNIASGDLNSDGRTDLVVANIAADEIIIFLGNSSGVPTRTRLTTPDRPANAGIGDFNHDQTLKVLDGWRTLSGLILNRRAIPEFSFLEPWAEISERLRRSFNFKRTPDSAAGLKT